MEGMGPPPPDAGSSFDVGSFRTYISSLLLPGESELTGPENLRYRTDLAVMSASSEDIEDSLFEDSSFEEKATRFASDSGCQVVYITKETFIDVDDDGELCETDCS